MKFDVRKLRVWPRTLGMQLIVVTAIAVLFSNVAVAYWFERVNERQNDTFFTDRLLDRTAQLAGSLSAIPMEARGGVTRTVSQGPYRFVNRIGTVPAINMTAEEKTMAARLIENLPPEMAKNTVTVRRAIIDVRANRRGGPDGPGGRGNSGGDTSDRTPVMAQVVDATVQIDDQSYLMARSTRIDPGSQWPIENRIATVLSILVTAAGAGFLANRMSRPLSKLTAAASEVAKGGTAPRVPEEGPDDVRKAAVAFNAMTDQVQRTLASQRQLLTAVGHDLRTPITAMRITMEFVEDTETRERLEKNLNELQSLTEAVLSAAKGAGGEPKRNVDMAALLESLCADLEEIGEPVAWENHAPAPFNCRPNEITRAVRNLVENAVAYGKNARVRLEGDKKEYVIVVEDDGPGIPDTDRERVFEPFVRLEASRNLETGGTGLGLTLVKAIAEGHGGSVVLENRPEGGLSVKLHLPRQLSAA